MRSSAAFNLGGLAIIRPAADAFDPKTIRSSMGAIFSLPFSYFDRFEDYLKVAGNRHLYPFMIEKRRNARGGNPREQFLVDLDRHAIVAAFAKAKRGLQFDFVFEMAFLHFFRKSLDHVMTATKEVGSVIKAIQEGTFDNIRNMPGQEGMQTIEPSKQKISS